MKGKIYGGLETVINFFTHPKIMRTFAPSMVTYFDHQLNPEKNRRTLFPSFDFLMSEGKWLCVGIPKATYHRATDIICTLLKQQFQCTALQRTSPAKRRLHPEYNFDRMIALMIDEYHIFATVGDTQDCDNNFFSLNRQSKVFAILATQTIENLKGKFKSAEYTSQLLGCCRNKVFLGVEDIETAEYASKMVGEGLVYRVSKSLGENQSDAPYSVFAGGYASEEAGLNQSLSFNQQVDRILRPKFFLELRSFSGVAVCYDGDQRFIVRLYLKPYWRDPTEAFHWQVAQGILSKTNKVVGGMMNIVAWIKNRFRRKPEHHDPPRDRTRYLIGAGCMVALVLLSRLFPVTQTPTYVALIIDGRHYFLEYAARKGQLRQGLRYRPTLAENSGMFFDLGETRPVTVTMDGVNFPLTVITLTEQLQVLEVTHLQPKARYAFCQPCRYMVEILVRQGLQPGDYLATFTPDAAVNVSLIPLPVREVF
ncbi:MAG: TraM recognition domain-containing protein [Acidobacteriota bacterium]|nr:TraM recognition domain-containing protein [Acidobacteriota bacterium]